MGVSAPWTVHTGDALAVLQTMPATSVHCCVTSPPYFALRDYGVEGQIGLESSLDEFLHRLVEVFREVRRVLRDDGTLWLNIGDSFAGGGRGGGGSFMRERGDSSWRMQASVNGWSKPPEGLKPKDLMMVPARLALALQADGWWLRSEIVWKKERPMPEAVLDRPTKSHEIIYLLSKRESYFYDGFAIREPVTGGSKPRGRGVTPKDAGATAGVKANESFHAQTRDMVESRNARDVWTFDANPLRGEDHYAAFPEELPRRCIRAGTSEHGVCATCGAPLVRVVDREKLLDGAPVTRVPPLRNTSKSAPSGANGIGHARVTVAVRHAGWKRSCEHDVAPAPAVVLDPFCGSGTTGIVALSLGRGFVGVELNPKYAAMAKRRIKADAPLFNASTEGT